MDNQALINRILEKMESENSIKEEVMEVRKERMVEDTDYVVNGTWCFSVREGCASMWDTYEPLRYEETKVKEEKVEPETREWVHKGSVFQHEDFGPQRWSYRGERLYETEEAGAWSTGSEIFYDDIEIDDDNIESYDVVECLGEVVGIAPKSLKTGKVENSRLVARNDEPLGVSVFKMSEVQHSPTARDDIRKRTYKIMSDESGNPYAKETRKHAWLTSNDGKINKKYYSEYVLESINDVRKFDIDDIKKDMHRYGKTFKEVIDTSDSTVFEDLYRHLSDNHEVYESLLRDEEEETISYEEFGSVEDTVYDGNSGVVDNTEMSLEELRFWRAIVWYVGHNPKGAVKYCQRYSDAEWFTKEKKEYVWELIRDEETKAWKYAKYLMMKSKAVVKNLQENAIRAKEPEKPAIVVHLYKSIKMCREGFVRIWTTDGVLKMREMRFLDNRYPKEELRRIVDRAKKAGYRLQFVDVTHACLDAFNRTPYYAKVRSMDDNEYVNASLKELV